MLWSASIRHLLRHPAQLVLALMGLALGVATITAVDIATASSGTAFRLSMDAVNGTATHQITGGPAGIDERLYVSMRMSGREIEFAPVVEGYVVVGGQTLQLIGIDPVIDTRVRGSGSGADRVLGDGNVDAEVRRWFTEPGTVIMTARTAANLGISSDTPFELRVGGQVHQARLLAAIEDEENVGSDTLILTDIAQAQEWLGLIGRLSRIDLRVPEGARGEKAVEALRAELPPGVELYPAERRTQQSLDMTTAFMTNLRAMSLLALLVSVFLIYSAVSFAVIQRRRTFGVLRALGATPGELLRIVLAEAAVLGAIGAGLGLLIGTFIGRKLIALVSRTINDLYFVVAVNEVVIPPQTILKAVLAGWGVSLIAAALPAWEVTGSAPQLGLRRSVIERRTVRAAAWLVAVSAAFAVVAGLIVWFSDRSLLAGFVALFLLLVSVAALTPAVLRGLARVAASTLGRSSAIARLAFGEVAGSLSRTAVAVAALGLAVAAMLGVSIMVESFRTSLRDWLERTLRADVYVTAPGPGFGRYERRLEPEVIEKLLSTPGIARHSESRRVIVESPSGPIPIDALNLTPEGYRGLQLVEGDAERVPQLFERGAVIVSEPLAWRLKLSAGGTLTLSTDHGPREFPIAAVYREYGNDRGNVLMSRNTYRELWNDDSITALGLYLQPGVSPEETVAALRSATSQDQALLIRSNAEIRELSMRIFERTFVITRVLYWLAAGVAAIGLVSALLAWELERSRELALLRSLGLTPRGAGMLIETQTGFMGFVALLAAIPAGVLTALLLIEVINRRAFGWRIELHLEPTQFLNALVLALSAALVAGIYPAWRSARAPLATEMREE
jgi:putative ABC transport system permease protein